VAPLREEGIQKPVGGQPHGGDEEDTIKVLMTLTYQPEGSTASHLQGYPLPSP
jgi:hypothetical protein